MLTVYGRANSMNVQKVMWLAAELDLSVRRVDIGGAYGGNDQPEYLLMNPNGLIPTLTDDDFTLWESQAILRYLASRYDSGSWWPDDVQIQGLASQWLDWYLTSIHAPATVIFISLIRQTPEQRDEDQITRSVRTVTKHWILLDRYLATTPFVAGDAPTLGDIPLAIAAYRWFTLDIERPQLDYLAAWYARLSARSAFQEQVMLPLS